MSRRAKLITLAIFLVLLAIPLWHVGSNWAPADPLRFRLISRERLPGLEFELDGVREAYRQERVEVEVRNTSTAPRLLENAEVRWYPGKTNASMMGYRLLVDSQREKGPIIPPGGTWRGSSLIDLPEYESKSADENRDPGYVQLEYRHASTFRRDVCQWLDLLTYRYLPESQKMFFIIHGCTQSTATLENFP